VKWRMVLTSVPPALLVALLSYVRADVFHWPAVVEFSNLTPLITGVVLIIGFMLASVMADHKDSERLPGQLASALESYSEIINGMAANNGERDAQVLRDAHFELVVTAEHWLLNPGPAAPCFAAVRHLSEKLEHAEVAKGIAPLYRSAIETMAAIRGAIGRVNFVRLTSAIPSGYALLQAAVGAVLILLVIAKFPTPSSQFSIVFLLSLVLICFTRLIRDLDDPFDYRNGKYSAGTNEVDPFPLLRYREYLESSFQPAGGTPG